MKSLKDIKKIVTKFNVKPGPEMRSNVLDEALEIQKNKQSTSDTYTWRVIMKSRITKFAAAAVIIIAVCVWLQIPSSLLPTAYALQDTIEAYSSIRSLHIKEFYMAGQEKRTTEAWIECDDYGRPRKFRFEAPNIGGPVIGPVTAVSDGNGAEAWLPKFNLCFSLFRPDDASGWTGWQMSEIDMKLIFENLYEQQRQGEIILEVNEPDRKSEPIVVIVTYPEGSRSENWKKMLYIDQATRLVKKLEKYEMRNGQYQHARTVEFFDYNRQIDPEIFSLEEELPDDVIFVDQSDEEIGLAQGDMTDEEIAVELGIQLFEALIAEDYSKAGALYCGVPGFVIEPIFTGMKLLEITSVGQAYAETDPDTNAMISSCKVLVEYNGQILELDVDEMQVVPVSGQPGRWMIWGIWMGLGPPRGGVTVSKTGVDLDSVTYDNLEPGEFMKKWLVLDPIWIEVRGDTLFPVEETQKDYFETNQINVAQFEPAVTFDGKYYEWSLLESEYGTVDLTSVNENWYLVTYLYSQIDMPEEKQRTLGIGSDDSVKVWLNGELVHENWTTRGVNVDEDRVSVNFQEGMNQLVIKVQNQGGPWGFCCRLLDE